MSRRLSEALSGKEGNYVIPFFWQHGEEEEVLRTYMRAIYESGIKAVCVESRPHLDYLGEKWWKDMDVILEEAGRLDMKVWVLDDSHFPTGCCNGKIKEHPEYGKICLDHYTVDVKGPMAQASFLVHLEEGEKFLGAVAARRKNEAAGELDEACDITDHVVEKRIYWSVPEGNWNVIVLKTTMNGGGRKDYCNLLDRQAVRFFIDTVYEAHYAHYREQFGNVFAGFFSDEPQMGNTFEKADIGQPAIPLPWCREAQEKTRHIWGCERNIYLASLWSKIDGYSEKARYEYMNLITDLYGVNFCGQVGEWCTEHGVEYIGHVIEDNGNHARTGYGTGHFFKALWGQHMSGVDVVLQQIRPEFDDRDFYNIGGKNTYDGVFFHYGLGKLGSSLAALDAKKRGRTMCELYGAYGWSEGLKLMKWIADHMLVRGVNWFVPHAFSPGKFPDPDCPPHFYAHGLNPQYPWFGDLIQYLNRMSHLFNGGKRKAKTAILYTAESGWIGECTPFEVIGRLLATHQIDYDVVPLGLLETAAASQYKVLVVPECQRIPRELQNRIHSIESEGRHVLFVGNKPDVTDSRWEQAEEFLYWKKIKNEERAAKQEKHEKADCLQRNRRKTVYCGGDTEYLLREMEAAGVREVTLSAKLPNLRYHHYFQEDSEFYLFFNEAAALAPEKTAIRDVAISVDFRDFLEKSRKLYWYHCWENRLEEAERRPDGSVILCLEPGETVVLCNCAASATLADFAAEYVYKKGNGKAYNLETACNWRLALRRYDSEDYGEWKEITSFENITGKAEIPDFSGNMCYQTEFFWNTAENGCCAVLDCGQVYETLEVWVNDKKQGTCISFPYRCLVTDLKDGKNEIRLVVTNTLVHALCDRRSATMPVEPSGLSGPVTLYTNL